MSIDAEAAIQLADPNMPHRPKLALVIPTLREAAALPHTLERVLSALSLVEIPWEIVVVDDDSGDRTAEIVRAAARRDARVRLLVRRAHRGLAGAILHGWRHSSACILGVMDADLQHPPELLPHLLAEILNGSDLAIGSRYARGAALDGWSPLRKFISSASVRLTWPLLASPVRPSDPLSGFFLVRRACVERVAFHTSGFKLLLEILVRGRVRSVSEVPLVFCRRASGHSKAGARVAWEYVRLLAWLYADKLGFRPSAISSLPSATMLKRIRS
jgi:dolichol-phosphate mannosyltransferase